MAGKRQAQLAARRATQAEEIVTASLDSSNGEFASWVFGWLKLKYAHRDATTYDRYCRNWRRLEEFLTEQRITRPRQVTYAVVSGYLDWRLQRGGSRNTGLYELRLLGAIMQEAKRRQLFEGDNPCQKLGIRKETPKEKSPWTDEQIQTVGQDLAQNQFGSWLQCTFLLGIFQAARLRQCAVPITGIDFATNTISYPATVVKGAKPFTQPIAPDLVPTLKKIVALRTAQGATTLCEIPPFASLKWRWYLDRFGYEGVSHHCLRVSWISRAAKAGVPISQAMRFVNHSSQTIHRLYQKLSSSDISGVPALVPLPSF